MPRGPKAPLLHYIKGLEQSWIPAAIPVRMSSRTAGQDTTALKDGGEGLAQALKRSSAQALAKTLDLGQHGNDNSYRTGPGR